MVINFKELLSSDLSNITLDKINYNFDQILVNGGGPRGYQGARGPQGFDGLTGDTGPQGAQGSQGPQGAKGDPGLEAWKSNEGTNNNTLVPVHGAKTNPPTVMIGVDIDDAIYDTIIEDTSFLINKKDKGDSEPFYNVVFSDDAVANTNGNYAYVSLDYDTVIDKVIKTEGFSELLDTINKKIASKFIFAKGGTELVTIDDTVFNSSVKTKFNTGLEINNGTFKIGIGTPALNKILASTDAFGNSTWKSVSEIGGAVPVGTIVPILTNIFDNASNFDQDAFLASDASALRIYYGRGKGDYKGWYLCNGQTWTNATKTFTTQDLCSFSYNITNNTNRPTGAGQGPASLTNSILSITGGSDVDMDATYNGAGSTYTVTSNLNTTPALIYPSVSGTAYDLYKMVYVVYLGEEDLAWSESGNQGVIIGSLTFGGVALGYSMDNAASCSAGTNLYDLVVPPTNPTFSTWETYTDLTVKNAWRNATLNTEGPTGKVYLYQAGTTIPAITGYYAIDGYLRFVSAGVVFDNLVPTPSLENGDAMTCITPTARFDSIGGPTSKGTQAGTSVTMYASNGLPSWRNAAQLTYSYQWQTQINGNQWVNVNAATSNTLTVTAELGTAYYRVGIILLDAATSTQSSTHYSNQVTLTTAPSYEIIGTRTVNLSTTPVSGTIVVSGASATISLITSKTYFAAGNATSRLVINGANDYEINGNVDTGDTFMQQTIASGNYTYTLYVYGPNTGANARIE